MTTFKRSRRLLFAFLVSVGTIFCLLGSPPLAAGDSGAYDPRDEGRTLTQLLYDHRLVHGQQKAYWRVGLTDIQINVYGVGDSSTQQRIIEALQKARNTRSRKRVRLTFYPDEQFKRRRLPNGVVEAERLPQQPLGAHVIDAKH